MKTLAFIIAMLVPGALQAQVVPGIVTGQLLSKEGQPVAGVRISAMAVPESNIPPSAASTLMSLTLTDNAGRYRLDNVPPGRYYIIAGLVETPTYYPGVSSASSATSVAVTAGATVPNINFSVVIPPGVTVSGRVVRPTTPTASPIAGRVALLGQASPIQEMALNSDGSFQFTKVRPGNYSLIVSGGQLSQPLNIVVADKDIGGVEAVIVPTSQLTGNVVVEGNGLLPRFSLTLTSFRGGVTASNPFLQASGSFQAQVPEGEYRVAWSALPAGYYLKSITSGTADLLTNPLKVVGGTFGPPLIVTLGVASPVPWVKVSGRVKGLPTNTLNPPRVTMSGLLVAEALDVPLNPDGSFVFPRVLPGTYTARFIPPLPVPVASIVVGNRDMDSVEIVLPAMRELTGRVIVEGIGTIAPRLSVTWVDPGSAGTIAPAVSQPDGTFKVTLPEGERRVLLTAPGYSVRVLTYGPVDLLRDPLRVTSTSSDEFRVTLTPTATTGVGGVGVGTGTGIVVGGVPGGILGGVVGGVLSATITPPLLPPPAPLPPPPAPLPPPPATSSQGTPTRIGGDVAQSNLVSSVPPRYPELARAARVSGVVILQVVITREGVVENTSVLSGHTLLTEAAVEAVKQWRYKPRPTPVVTTVTVNFSIQ